MNDNKIKKLIFEFETSFNELDNSMRSITNSKKGTRFYRAAEILQKRFPKLIDLDEIDTISRVRNIIVHQKKKNSNMILPTKDLIDRMNEIEERIASTINKYCKFVTIIDASDSLAAIMKMINEHEYTQFPTYENDKFAGLLTENGIVRWLSHHVTTELSLVDLEDTSVKSILKQEEYRRNYKFFPRTCPEATARQYFREHPMLDAIIITESGKEYEKPVGIMTSFDIKGRF